MNRFICWLININLVIDGFIQSLDHTSSFQRIVYYRGRVFERFSYDCPSDYLLVECMFFELAELVAKLLVEAYLDHLHFFQ